MESMGQQFRAARERKRINISRAAALTRIKVQHLEMMENDDFSHMPAPTYARGFIRIYAGFLGLDPSPYIKEYNERHLHPAASPDRAPRSARRGPPPTTAAIIEDVEPDEDKKPVAAGDWKKRWAAMVPALRRTGRAALSWLPRLMVMVALIAILLLIGRCVGRLSSAVTEAPAESGVMREDALMREPPDRYLEIPTSKESAP